MARRWWGPASFYAVTGVLLVVGLAGTLSDGGGPARGYGDVALMVTDVVGVACAVAAACHRGLDPRTRRAWRFIAAAVALLALVTAGHVVLPMGQLTWVGDGLRLAFTPVMLTGLL